MTVKYFKFLYLLRFIFIIASKIFKTVSTLAPLFISRFYKMNRIFIPLLTLLLFLPQPEKIYSIMES